MFFVCDRYQAALEEIKAKTGIDQIDVMVQQFIAQEDKNFSLFNYVNSQTHEIEKLEDEIEQLTSEQERLSAEEDHAAAGGGGGGGDGAAASQRNQLQVDLHRRLAAIKTSTETYDGNFSDLEKVMASLKVGIQHIFNKIGCDVSAMSDMLADSHVTEVNMMQYLGIIEQRTNEILQAWAIHKSQPAGGSGSSSGGGGGSSSSSGSSGNAWTAGGSSSGGGARDDSDDDSDGGPPKKPASPTFKISAVIGQGPAHPVGDQKIQIAPPAMEEYASGEEDSADEEDVQMPQSLDSIIADVKKYMGRRETTSTTRKAGGKKKP